jgi:serine phosphatase RsbU (regulator of sigma subunit)
VHQNNTNKEKMQPAKLLFTLILFLPITIFGQGLPLIESYRVTNYGGGIQNWAIESDQYGIVYFSHNNGLSSYDGAQWDHLQNANKSHIRCLAIDSTGRLFAGGTSEFGYFAPNLLGELEYTSLLGRFTDTTFRFADIWSMATSSSGVLFTVRGNVLFYDYDSVRIIKTKTSLVSAFGLYDKLFLHSTKEGIFQFTGGRFVPLPGLEKFASETYLRLATFHEQKILVVTESSGVWIYDYKAALEGNPAPGLEKIVTPIEKNIAKELLNEVVFDTARNIIHIATTQNIFSIDTSGYVLHALNHTHGIVDKSIISIKSDRIGNLWVGCGSGISYIHISSPVTVIDHRMGIPEHPYHVCINEDFALFTNISGLYYTPTENLVSFQKNPLIPIHLDPNGGWAIHCERKKVFVSVGTGIYELDKTKLGKRITPITAYSMETFSVHESTLFIGGVDRSFLLKTSTTSKAIPLDLIRGAVRNVVHIKENHLVGEVSYKGLFNLYRDKKNELVVEWIEKKHGLNPSNEGVPVLLDSIVYICSPSGLLRVNFKPDNSVDTVFTAPQFESIAELKKGINDIKYDKKRAGYWVFVHDGIAFIELKDTKPMTLKQSPFRILPDVYSMKLYRDFIITPSISGVYFYDLNKHPIDTFAFNTVIRSVQFDNEEVFGGYSNLNKSSSQNITIQAPIDYKRNRLRVSFTAPYYFYQDSIRYECKLHGFDNNWVDTKSKTEKEYTNLPPGEYCFEVRAINVFGIKSESAKTFFSISTPWYRTVLARFAYIIFGGLLFLTILKFYTYRLKRANLRLEDTIRLRTQELQVRTQNINAQNEKIKNQNTKILEQSKKLEDANRQLSQLSVVAQSTDNGVIIVKFPRTIQFINDGMSHMLDLDNSTQLDEQLKDGLLFRFQNLTKQITDVFENPESRVFESILTTFQQRKKWLQISLSPVIEPNIAIDRVVVVCTDITAMKLAEEEISQQREELLAQSELLESINSELERANQMMTDSINYAQRIQNSMLPDLKGLRKIVDDTFVFYKPKDIVSGDFYWYKKVGDSHIFISADCTGHGVPGAFMSMIGHTLLKELTDESKTQNPAQILGDLNESIQTILRQKEKSDEIQDDGMDVTVCIYKPLESKVLISLANHSACLIKNGVPIQIDGEIFSVGGNFSGRTINPFTYSEYAIDKGDLLYMYTDGFHDQLGGETYSKYGSTRFNEFLMKIHHESFIDQVELLSEEYFLWKEKRKQTDDILIWGIKF